MSRARHKLTASQVLAASKPGSLGDGAGLFLKTSTGKVAGKRWVLIYPTRRRRLASSIHHRVRHDGDGFDLGSGWANKIGLT